VVYYKVVGLVCCYVGANVIWARWALGGSHAGAPTPGTASIKHQPEVRRAGITMGKRDIYHAIRGRSKDVCIILPP